MIELIFAIVVIAITVMSLPVMTQVNSSGMETNLVQEAIFTASAELNQALSYKWDRNSQENFGELSKIVGTAAQDCNSATRPGLVHRMCLNNQAVNADDAIYTPISENDKSINNVIESNATIFETGDISSGSGYKGNYTMDINVSFANFDSNNPTGDNIKEIKITVKKDGNDYVVLKTYSANIGETEAFKRVF